MSAEPERPALGAEPDADGGDGTSVADELYIEFRARVDAGDEVDLDALCARYPGLADDLRGLDRARAEAAEVFEGIARPACFRELVERLGADPPPGEEPAARRPWHALWRRIVGKGPVEHRYEPRGAVAGGGMGEVLRVWDADLQRTLAMKVARTDGVRDDALEPARPREERMLARFLEEAQVTGQLDHPGIVPVHELGVDAEGRPFFTMKLVRGEDLRSVFAKVASGADGWTQTRALNALLKVCEAVAYAHDKGVIHRDLKPSNVMVGRYGEVYVMDWGLAKVLGRPERAAREPAAGEATVRVETWRAAEDAGDPDAPLYTLDGQLVGTPAYMSPEQAACRQAEVDAQTDVYGVGAMLYHLLTCDAPYTTKEARSSPRMIALQVVAGPPAPVRARQPDVRPELEAICRRAMARSKALRYPSMRALADDLQAYLDGRVVAALGTGLGAKLGKWVARNRPLAASLGGAALLLVAWLAALHTLRAKSEVAAQEARLRAAAEEREAAARVARRVARRNEELAQQRIRQLVDDGRLLQALVAEADGLWPVTVEQVPRYEDWLARARALVDRVDSHRPVVAGGAPAAVVGDPQDAEFAEWREYVRQLGAILAERQAPLLRLFRDRERGLIDGTSLEHGWGVARRLELARRVDRDASASPEARMAWLAAREYVADARSPYGGLELAHQRGLLPLGADPRSGLYEFAHLASGSLPERDVDHLGVVAGEESCVVLVLLPGGTFAMGAQPADPGAPNHDGGADPTEQPVHAVELEPFFLAKHELTQGQWLRLTGENPSAYSDDLDRAQPVEWRRSLPLHSVSWDSATRVLERIGLSLPTEAQWEYAARGGTATRWWTGDEPGSLDGACNLADRAALESSSVVGIVFEDSFHDGYAFHAPVGRFRANPFGLHDVLGNVMEWCADACLDYADVAPRAGDGLRATDAVPSTRCVRGGSMYSAAPALRSAFRDYYAAEYRAVNVGLRPARALER